MLQIDVLDQNQQKVIEETNIRCVSGIAGIHTKPSFPSKQHFYQKNNDTILCMIQRTCHPNSKFPLKMENSLGIIFMSVCLL